MTPRPGRWTGSASPTRPAGTVRAFSVVPSLDTPVCGLQTTRFDADQPDYDAALAAIRAVV